MGYPISAIILPQKDKLVNKLFLKQRQLRGLNPISVGPSLKECFRKLKEKEVVAILGDKNFGISEGLKDKFLNEGDGVEVEFFGKKAYFPKGPTLLAYRTDSNIVPGFTIKGKDNKYTLYLEKPIKTEKCKDKDEFIRSNTQKIAEVIEKYVSLYPEQWMIFEKVWK